MKNTNEVRKRDALQCDFHSGDFARRLGNDTARVIDVCSLIDSNVCVNFIRRFLGLLCCIPCRTAKADSLKVSTYTANKSIEWILWKYNLSEIQAVCTAWFYSSSTDWRGRVINTTTSYSGGPGFRSRCGDLKSWLQFLVVLLSP
jgi:hypothetical protein